METKVVISATKGEDVLIFAGENKVSLEEDINIFEVEGARSLRLEDVFKSITFDGVNSSLTCEDIGIFIEDENGKEEFNFSRTTRVVFISILRESLTTEDAKGTESLRDIFTSEDLR